MADLLYDNLTCCMVVLVLMGEEKGSKESLGASVSR